MWEFQSGEAKLEYFVVSIVFARGAFTRNLTFTSGFAGENHGPERRGSVVIESSSLCALFECGNRNRGVTLNLN